MKEKKTDLSQYLFSFRCKRCQTVHHSHSCRRFTVFFFLWGGVSAVTKTMTFSNVLGSMCVFYERDDASEPFLLLLLPCSDWKKKRLDVEFLFHWTPVTFLQSTHSPYATTYIFFFFYNCQNTEWMKKKVFFFSLVVCQTQKTAEMFGGWRNVQLCY